LDLETELLKAHIRKQTDSIVALIGVDRFLFEKLMELITQKNPLFQSEPLGHLALLCKKIQIY